MSQAFLQMIQQANYIAVVAQEEPDADSLGSASAIYSFLLQLHKKIIFVCKTSELDRKFMVIPWVKEIKNDIPSGIDLAIVCDCTSYRRAGFAITADIINIDHHPLNGMYGKLNIVNSAALSTTQVLFELFKSLGIGINKKMATALYAGVIDKSDAFMSQQCNGMTFALAQELITLGADHGSVVKYLRKYSTLSHIRLLGAMLLEMELHADASVAVFCVEQTMLERYGAKEEDTKEALEKAMELPTVRFAVACIRRKNSAIKVSLRAFTSGIVAIAQKYGGDGYALHAECEFSQEHSLESIKKIMIEEVKQIEKKEK